VDEAAAEALGGLLVSRGWREAPSERLRAAQVEALASLVEPTPWPELPPSALSEEITRPWLLAAVCERLRQGDEQFLPELRPVANLFLAFEGIDYDDDDDAAILLDAYLRRVQAALARYEGTLLQLTMGDKGSYLNAAFGAPVAHDDDAARAVAAALELLLPTSGLGYVTGLRIGVTQGQMYTGAYGSPTRRTYGVLGDKTNLAARLMQAAGPGEALCDYEIYQSARRRWAFETLPAIRVKGKAGMVRVYRPNGQPADAAAQAEASAGKQPLVGRLAARERLEAALRDLQTGKGKVLFIEGEAGIGKTRLVNELIQLARQQGLAGLLGAGQSIEQGTPYRAWRDIFASYFELVGIEEAGARRARVQGVAQEVAPKLGQRLPLLNDVLNLGLADTPLTSALDQSLRKESLAGLLLHFLRAWTQERPLILILEDAHWLDSLSWELAVQIGRALLAEGAPLLLVIVARLLEDLSAGVRPAAQLRALPGTETIELGPLDPAEIRALIASRLQVSPQNLPVSVSKLAEERSEGNPFFAEELADMLLDHGLIERVEENGAWVCVIRKDLAQAEAALPGTLQGLILSRIDRLPPEKQFTLKVAAVLGRTFTCSPLFETVNRFMKLPLPALQAHLDDLTQHHLTQLEAPEPELTYIFKHIITQEVAYQTLLFAQRKQIHKAVGKWYEDKLASEKEVNGLYLPLLVYHFHQADEPENERKFARLAGEQAVKQYANAEAVKYLSRALELTAEEDLANRIELLLLRENVYNSQGARAAQAHDLAVLEALTLQKGEPALQAETALRKAWFEIETNNYEAAQATAREAARLAQEAGDTFRMAKAYMRIGSALRYQAKYAEARQIIGQALALAEKARFTEIERSCFSNLGVISDLSGDSPQAQAYLERFLELSRQAKDRADESTALNNLGVVVWRKGDLPKAQELFEQSLFIDREIGKRTGEGMCLGNLALLATPWGIMLRRISGGSRPCASCVRSATITARAVRWASWGRSILLWGIIRRQRLLLKTRCKSTETQETARMRSIKSTTWER
jgi:predicted ATPase/class 3 adenylate cyclase